ncbi:tyrosine-type recombinase/integrase [Alcaligenes sp. MMA]|uniref:tyrosine-type recombinase/integrase n=1 Tax=Alcaligenes sp. MMA TaxID=2893019 RepID=UPI001E2F06DF|nr:tyrosine-type recombinase/integrase [Alcaligenes sp. MMA]MCC9163244.1 tyrosine-type recombinase/integrase [Alcaligenes sp. MMA]
MLLVELKKSTNPHVDLVSRICLATGVRWSEAEQLQPQQIRQRLIQFARTKTGKARAVPISQKIQDKILAHHAEHRNMGAIFTSCTGAFKEAIERAGIELPLGQLTHVLRHTFASHFMINGGNILTLQRILGNQDLKTTMRYAHLAPEHLDTARTLNPLMTC